MRTLLALLVLAGSPLLADDVYLKNGRSFENVVAEVGDSQVRIYMPGGVISLPRGAVERVRKADSSFPEYLKRKQEIESREASSASTQGGAPGSGGARPEAARLAQDWLDLARWASRNNLQQGSREAALAAAAINPRLPGLTAVLRAAGYVYEETLDRWIPYDDAMRLHGFVKDGGTWISREEHAERVRAAERARAERQMAFAAQAQAAATSRLADAELLRAQIEAAGGGYPYGGGYTLGGYYGGLWPFGFSSGIFSVPAFGGRRFGEHRGDERREHHGERRPFGPAANGAATFFGNSTVFGAPTGPTSFFQPSAVFGQPHPPSVVFIH
jgi:hypothetical protein